MLLLWPIPTRVFGPPHGGWTRVRRFQAGEWMSGSPEVAEKQDVSAWPHAHRASCLLRNHVAAVSTLELAVRLWGAVTTSHLRQRWFGRDTRSSEVHPTRQKSGTKMALRPEHIDSQGFHACSTFHLGRALQRGAGAAEAIPHLLDLQCGWQLLLLNAKFRANHTLRTIRLSSECGHGHDEGIGSTAKPCWVRFLAVRTPSRMLRNWHRCQ